jgi:diadenosine tetraphosphate (Ap4A) HIT family hydrolase
MNNCMFCKEDFGIRKLGFEDKNGYWYTVVPEEIGTFGQVLMVVRKMKKDERHITDVTDPMFQYNEERLISVIKGIHEISTRLKKCLTDQGGRRAEKIYVLTQCENENSHLHFQFLPRYERDPTGNEFLYACELEEARWQDPPKKPLDERIRSGKHILARYERLLKRGDFIYTNEHKSKELEKIVQKLNHILE